MKEAQQDSMPTAVDNLIERSVIGIGIPPCPAILERFIAESRKIDPDYNRLATIIGTDVGLSAGMIKTANSPFFGMRQRVRSVNEALAILGLNTASRAIAAIILRKTFPNVPNMERFWDASSRIARVSGWLAQNLEIKGLHADDACTFGLFRDCGIPVLFGRFPNYEALLAKANQEAIRSFTEVEETELPTNHSMIGCILAQSWWLPEAICLAIRNHHDIEALQSADIHLPVMSRKLIATSQLAEHLVQHQMGQSLTQEWSKLMVGCMQILDLSKERLEALYTEAVVIVQADE